MAMLRWLILISASLLLSGCFISETLLFSPADADLPLADGTVLITYALDDAGKRKDEPPSRLVVERKEQSYIFKPDGDGPFRAIFDDMGNGYFVAAELDVASDTGPQYGLVHQVGESWFAYTVTCSDFEALIKKQKKLADFHIKKSGSQCRFTSYDDVKNALMFIADNTKPNMELIAEK